MGRVQGIFADLRRLQAALESIAADLDAMEGRQHPLLRGAAKRLQPRPARSIESFVQNFAFVIERKSTNKM
ncbi:MAG: hypothetical protein HY852_08410 [Bradyrhizobium sp.]|uniref:hypothetical protein n=1 Tax=Bradyrhizobium sp. TaxID=376 RepID=UPI0025C3124B|nr:hypothetical protein [Bradyrhizobium sp.]MBI5261821.1 hypothetical protein [Bradyrhizobium sp.]